MVKKIVLIIYREFFSVKFRNFFLIGLVTASVNLGSRFIFQLVLNYELSVMFAVIAASLLSYLLNSKITFKTKVVSAQFLMRFIISSAMAIALTTILSSTIVRVYIFFNFSFFNLKDIEFIAHFISVGVVSTIFSFLMSKNYVYRK